MPLIETLVGLLAEAQLEKCEKPPKHRKTKQMVKSGKNTKNKQKQKSGAPSARQASTKKQKGNRDEQCEHWFSPRNPLVFFR